MNTPSAPLGPFELDQSQPEIYDRPIQLRVCYQGPGSGAEHYLVRYSPGLRSQPIATAPAHTIIVLEGAMEVDGQLLQPGRRRIMPPAR